MRSFSKQDRFTQISISIEKLKGSWKCFINRQTFVACNNSCGIADAVCMLQRCSAVEYRQVFSIITQPLQHSPPAPWSRSPPATVTLCRATRCTAPRVPASRPAGPTCPASCRCCCALSRTRQPADPTPRRRATRVAGPPDSASRRPPRPTTSWVSRTSASWLPDCSSVPSSGPGTYRSFPTYRHVHLTSLFVVKSTIKVVHCRHACSQYAWATSIRRIFNRHEITK